MQQYRSELTRITKTLLSVPDHYGELNKACKDLFELFLETSGLNIDCEENKEHIYLPNGKAIGPLWAALCIKEMIRTKRFLCGIQQGIAHVLKVFPNRPIHIVYAGTGPFATLALPLTTVYNSEEISFTFLEINPQSIHYLEKVIAAFRIEPYVKEIVCCDAARYQVDKNSPVHMIITETMQNALQKEPQVAITTNLAPQMENGGVLIPQNITIEAALVNTRKNMERMTGLEMRPEACYRVLSKIFELNKNTSENDLPVSEQHQVARFPELEVKIPDDIPLEYHQFALMTTIQVFAAEQIYPWQCSLTLPQNILNRTKEYPGKVGFRYLTEPNPGFIIESRYD